MKKSTYIGDAHQKIQLSANSIDLPTQGFENITLSEREATVRCGLHG